MRTITDQMLWDYIDGILPEAIAQEISLSADEKLQARIRKIQQFNQMITDTSAVVNAPSLSFKKQLLERYILEYAPLVNTKPLSREKWFFFTVAILCFVAMLFLVAFSARGHIEVVVNQHTQYIFLVACVCFIYTLSLFVFNFKGYHQKKGKTWAL